MKRFLFFLVISSMFSACKGGSPSGVNSTDEKACIMVARDREIVDQIIKDFNADRKLPPGELLLKVGTFFLETPYVANTLEVGDTEKLVVNLRELDCTTFAENILALTRTIQKKNPEFNDFISELELIRYRDGNRDGYPSRLHYFSDWIFDNDKKELVKSVSQEIAHTIIPNRVNYMSKHPESYPALKSHPEFTAEMERQEHEISNRMTWYIPKNKLAEFENQIQNGDIIGITTSFDGLDISHVVIAVRKNERIHILHASSKAMKVVFSDETLEQYLNDSKSATGIMVARPL